MAVVRYHEYIPELADEIDLGQLMSSLSDFLLESGFEGQKGMDDLDALYDALLDAIVRNGLLGEDDLADLLTDTSERQRFLKRLTERLENEGYLSVDGAALQQPQGSGSEQDGASDARFQL